MPCKGRTSGCRKLKSNQFCTIEILTNMQALSRTAILKLIEHSEKISLLQMKGSQCNWLLLLVGESFFCLRRACQVDQGMVMPCAYKRNGSWCSKLWVQPLPTFQSLLAPWNFDGNMLIKLIGFFIEDWGLWTIWTGTSALSHRIKKHLALVWTWLKPLCSQRCPCWQPACFAQCSSPRNSKGL